MTIEKSTFNDRRKIKSGESVDLLFSVPSYMDLTEFDVTGPEVIVEKSSKENSNGSYTYKYSLRSTERGKAKVDIGGKGIRPHTWETHYILELEVV